MKSFEILSKIVEISEAASIAKTERLFIPIPRKTAKRIFCVESLSSSMLVEYAGRSL